MDSEDNRALVVDVFDRTARGELTALTSAMSEDVRWTFPPGWSWSGTWAPLNRVVDELLRPLMRQFATYSLHAEQVVADGDHVVVRARAEATTTRGDPYPQRYCYVMTLRDGRIVEIVEYCNSALVERVLDPPERTDAPAGTGVASPGTASDNGH